MAKDDEVGAGRVLFGLLAISFLIYTIYDIFGGYLFIGFAALGVIGLSNVLWSMRSAGNRAESLFKG